MSSTYHLLKPRPEPRLLSLVIPLYNEEESVPLLRAGIGSLVAMLGCPTEVILVNDGSSDRTLELLLSWAAESPAIVILGLARNFGHQAAVTAGLDAAKGDAVVIMDGDLQDPPEVVVRMIAEYLRGYDVVYGQRRSRVGETWVKRVTAAGFYRFMRVFIHPDLPVDAGDFRLISRACLDALKSMREVHRFIRGMVAWVGFPQVAVQYDRPARAAGETKYPMRKMIRFAWTAAVSFSPLPLRVSLGLGLLMALFGVAVGVFAVGVKLFGFFVVPGWTSLIVVMSIIGGAVLVSNGILGEYVGRIFEESKGRPLYIVSVRANIGASDTGLTAMPSSIARPVGPADLGTRG